ncbi:MAG: AraC family transcriptional regulator [Clostridia bacterium]|nr:AraC family transcriptional regulator [Clostridia bacterium]
MTNLYYPEFKSGIKSFVAAFKKKFENEYYFVGEMHNFWELVCVTEGSLFVSEDSRIYKLNEGDIIFHKPMEFHKIWVEKDQNARAIVMSFESDDKNFAELGSGVFKLDAEKQNILEEVFHMIGENFNLNFYITRKDTPDIIDEKSTFMTFELLLLSILSRQNGTRGREYNAGAMNYKMIIDTMNENLSKNLSIDELAALCNLSVSNLKKIFSKYAGGGVMKHFNRLKIKKAMRLLKMDFSVAEIGRQLGFSSANYFAVVFRRETGMLPSEFRLSEKTGD